MKDHVSLQERLKDLRVEKGLKLEELAEKTGISKSALASYENEENRNKEINHGNLITLADYVIERLNREIRRRTRVVGSFPDGNSALMLVCARLRHVAGSQWGNKKYMNMKHLEAAIEDASIAG